MKTKVPPSVAGLAAPKRGKGGSIVIIFVVLLTIMMILVTAESRALIHLRGEIKFMEQQQIKRLTPPQTNAVPSALPQTK